VPGKTERHVGKDHGPGFKGEERGQVCKNIEIGKDERTGRAPPGNSV